MRPSDAFGVAGAGADVGVYTNANVGVCVSDDDGENGGTGSTSVARSKGETPPRGDSLCRSPRSGSVSMLKSRTNRSVVATSRSIFSLES